MKVKKVLALALVLALAMTLLPTAAAVTTITPTGFIPRTKAPEADNAYYYTKDKNPFYPSLVDQCTWYAWGRAYEISGKQPTWSSKGNGDQWLQNAKNAGYATGTEPQLGAIACWTSEDWYNNGYGHVAVVEAISGSKVTVSQYNVRNTKFSSSVLPTQDPYPTGYIYLPTSGMEPDVPESPEPIASGVCGARGNEDNVTWKLEKNGDKVPGDSGELDGLYADPLWERKDGGFWLCGGCRP